LRKRACDTDTLFLPAGELIDPAERFVGEPDAVKAGQRQFELGARQGEQTAQRGVKRKASSQYIVQRTVALDQLMILEDNCSTPPVLAQQMPRAEDAELPRYDLSGCRRHQVIDCPQQCRFSRAGAPEQDDELPAPKGNRGRAQRLDPAAIGHTDLIETEDRAICAVAGHLLPLVIFQL